MEDSFEGRERAGARANCPNEPSHKQVITEAKNGIKNYRKIRASKEKHCEYSREC